MVDDFDLPLDPALDGLDHVLVAVDGLEQAEADWTRLGFTCCPRGRHIGWGTANVCIMFETDYVELLGIVDPGQFTNNLDRVLDERGPGVLGVAFASDDPAGAAARLAERGVGVSGPHDLSRIIELPEGEARPAFQLLQLPPEARPALSAFVCHHLTRELVWRDDWTRHANGARRLRRMTVVVDQPGELGLPYARLFGQEAVRSGDGRVEIACGAATLAFVTPAVFAAQRPDASLGALPWPAGFAVEVADLAAARAHLEAAGVGFTERNDGTLLIDPAAASGVALELVG